MIIYSHAIQSNTYFIKTITTIDPCVISEYEIQYLLHYSVFECDKVGPYVLLLNML